MAADVWANASALATAGGTLVLAVATFASVRSANRSARAAERSLLANIRPLLMNSRLQDHEQKVGFQDNKWLRVGGSHGVAEVGDEAIYLAISLRNVGPGMAVLHGWFIEAGDAAGIREHTDLDAFHRLTRDLYVPPAEIGFWQGALRDSTTEEFKTVQALIENRERMRVQLLYGDHEGGQRVVTLFSMIPAGEAGQYYVTTARHWNIDRSDPR